MSIWIRYKNGSFVIKTTTGFVLGIIAGVLFGQNAIVLKPLGTILIHLLSFVAIPVIFLTVVLAVDQMNLKILGRMGAKLIMYYTATTTSAVLIGVGVALWFSPGKGLSLPTAVTAKPETPNFSDILVQIVPDNIFRAFSSGDLIAIMFVSVVIGVALSSMNFSGDKQLTEYSRLINKVLHALNRMFYKILDGVLLYVPIGVFAISASAVGEQGWSTVQSLLRLVGVFYLGVVILWLAVYVPFLKASGRLVIRFLMDTKEATATAFFTSSSIASLPIAIQSAKKAGVSETTANFALPLGAVFNSDGGALRMGISIVFAANITNLSLSVTDLIQIVVIGTILSVGAAGIPAAGLVTLSAVLTVFGLPLEIVGLIAGVDALIGMGGTASNVMGDIIGAAVIDKPREAD